MTAIAYYVTNLKSDPQFINMHPFPLFIIPFLWRSALSVDFEKCRILDLTHTAETGVPHHGEHDFKLDIIHRGLFLIIDCY